MTQQRYSLQPVPLHSAKGVSPLTHLVENLHEVWGISPPSHSAALPPRRQAVGHGSGGGWLCRCCFVPRSHQTPKQRSGARVRSSGRGPAELAARRAGEKLQLGPNAFRGVSNLCFVSAPAAQSWQPAALQDFGQQASRPPPPAPTRRGPHPSASSRPAPGRPRPVAAP